jgi:hypothetical protein
VTTASSVATSPTTAASGGSLPEVNAITWAMQAENQRVLSAIGSFPTATGNTPQGITATTIKVGAVADETAAGAPGFGEAFCLGAKSRFDQANADHQLSRTVQFDCADSGSDTTTRTSDLNQDVLSNKVFSELVFTAGVIGSNVLETNHVPYFGVFFDCGKSVVYGFNYAGSTACTAISKDSGGKLSLEFGDQNIGPLAKYLNVSSANIRFAFLSDNAPGDAQYAQGAVAGYKLAGVNVVDLSSSIPAGAGAAVDLTPYLQSVLASKPTVIGIGIASGTLALRAIAQLKQAGYTGKFDADFPASAMADPTTASILDGTISGSGGRGSPAFSSKYWDVVKADAKSVNGDVSLVGFQFGWSAAQEFIQGFKDFEATGKPITTENFTDFLNSGWIFQGFGDVVPPVIYPYGKYATPPCGSIAILSKAAKGLVPGLDLTCGTVIHQP